MIAIIRPATVGLALAFVAAQAYVPTFAWAEMPVTEITNKEEVPLEERQEPQPAPVEKPAPPEDAPAVTPPARRLPPAFDDLALPELPPPIYKPLIPTEGAKPPPLAHTSSVSDMITGLYFNEHYALTHGLNYSQDSFWTKTGRFTGGLGLILLGVTASAVLHELAHYTMAKMTGTPFEWPAYGKFEFSDGFFLPLWRIPDGTAPGTRNAIAWAGFAANMVATEVILWTPIPKDNLFILGFLGHSILNSLIYPITDLIKGGYGDIDMMRQAGGSVPAVHIILVLHSLSAIARLFFFADDFRGRFLPWVTPNPQGLDLVWAW